MHPVLRRFAGSVDPETHVMDDKALQAVLAAREQELSAIYQNAPGVVFFVAIDPDGEFRFVEMSETGLVAMGLNREQVVGALVRDVVPAASRDLVLNYYRQAIQSGRTVRWREVSAYPSGRKVGEVAITPVHAPNGAVTHLVGIVHDVTERERLEEIVRRREKRLAFLLTLNDALRPLSDTGEIQDVTLRLLGEHLGANRVAYAVIDGNDFIVTRSYENGVPSFRGRASIAAFGAALLDSYRRGEPVIANDVRTDPRLTGAERGKLLSYGIVAFVRVMLKKDGHWKATFGVNSATPRDWLRDEIILIEQTAERMWSAAERARTEQALRESEDRVRLVLKASGAGSWTRAPNANDVDWDEGMSRLYGLGPDERPTFDMWLDRIHEEDRARVVRLVDTMREPISDAWDVSYRIVRPDGSMAWIQSLGHIERDAAGEVVRLAGLELDVTAQHQAAVALQARRDEEHNRELRLLLETATQGVISVDGRGTILMANRALEAMFGWEPGELIGKSVEILVPASVRNAHARHRSKYFTTPHARLMAGLELRGERKDGTTFPIEVSLNHLATPSGGHAIAFVTDITERGRAATALRERTAELEYRSDQLRRLASDLTLAEQHAREQLARTLHDGLQQLLLIATLHLDEYLKQEEPQQGGAAERLVEARDHLNQAIAAARSLSVELFPPVLQRDGLPGALSWLAEWTRQKYGLDVRLSCDPLANSARRDVRTLLFESVRELVLNAVKHAQVDRIVVELARDQNDMLSITVSDDGVGFDPSAIMRQGAGGTAGWGLFSIQERLTLLGARFEIASAPGRGSRFRLVAPKGESPAAVTHSQAIPNALEPAAAVHIASLQSSRSLRILIADDHAALRKAFRQLLEKRDGLQVVGEAADGFQAIAQAHALQPDVILMDISMPRMDGIEATKLIHAEIPSVEIVGLSMYPRTEGPSLIEQAGASRFFTKGIDTQRLIDHLLVLQGNVTSAAVVGRAGGSI